MPNDSDEPTVSLDSITNTPVQPPNGTQTFEKNVDPFTGKRDERFDQQLGRVGKYIGGGPEKAGNIAYQVIIAAVVILVIASPLAAMIDNEKLATVYDRVVTGAFSLITGALGFLFGKSGAAKE